MDALASLRVHLENPLPRTNKAPKGFDDRLKATSKREIDAKWVVFLEAGFEAWYAYFAADKDTRAKVDGLSVPDLQNLAEELCKIQLHENVKELFKHLFNVADRRHTRHRLLEIGSYPLPTCIASRKRRRLASEEAPDITARTTPINVGPAFVASTELPDIIARTTPIDVGPARERQVLTINQIQPDVDAAQGLSTIDRGESDADTAQGLSVSGQGEELPLTSRLSVIFPPIILNKILKKADRAQVKAIQSESPGQSRLRLSIDPDSVPNLAEKIFDVNLSVQDGDFGFGDVEDSDVEDAFLRLELESGQIAKVMKISGARHANLERCFGNRVATAIRATPMFTMEVQQGKDITKCVSLKIRRDSTLSCSLTLMLDPKSLSAIITEIWPPTH